MAGLAGDRVAPGVVAPHHPDQQAGDEQGDQGDDHQHQVVQTDDLPLQRAARRLHADFPWARRVDLLGQRRRDGAERADQPQRHHHRGTQGSDQRGTQPPKIAHRPVHPSYVPRRTTPCSDFWTVALPDHLRQIKVPCETTCTLHGFRRAGQATSPGARSAGAGAARCPIACPAGRPGCRALSWPPTRGLPRRPGFAPGEASLSRRRREPGRWDRRVTMVPWPTSRGSGSNPG